ncbi:hypothetical protein T484DRAFT_1763646 [Baffinella frigidus]|nr:hypothetical protein T484DRAFT_1763646 [Cryptophyta sp. CCMP2293]
MACDAKHLGTKACLPALTLIFKASSTALPYANQTIECPLTSGLTLPGFGIPLDDPTRMIVTMIANQGDVLPTSIIRLPRIGALAIAAYTVAPTTAGAEATIFISFTPQMSLHPGEFLQVFLKDFTGPSYAVLNTTSFVNNVPSSKFVRGTWTVENQMVTLFVNEEVPALEITKIDPTPPALSLFVNEEVPALEITKIVIPDFIGGTTVPASGIGVVSEVLISSNAFNGEVDPTVLASLVVIPGVVRNTKLTLVPNRAGAVAEVRLRLQSQQVITAGASIRIKLPGFTGGSDCWRLPTGSPGLMDRCLHTNPADARYCMPLQTITSTTQDTNYQDEGGCYFRPRLRIGAHNELPQKVGACACLNNPAITASVTAAFSTAYPDETRGAIPANYGEVCGPWDATAADTCDNLWLGKTGPQCCSSWCFVSASCVSSVRWQGLTGGTPRTISYDTCADNEQLVDTCLWKQADEAGVLGIANASWTEADQYLVLTTHFDIMAFLPVTIIVPSEVGMRIPPSGLALNDPAFKVDVVDGQSRMDPLPILDIAALGSFHDVQVRFLGAHRGAFRVRFLGAHRSGVAPRIELKFQANMALAPGEIVSLVLPGFESESPPFTLASSTPTGAFTSGSWDAGRATAMLTVAASVPLETPITVEIPAGVVRLPAGGVRPGQSNEWFLYTNALGGPVYEAFPEPVGYSPAVGAMWNTAVIFEPPVFEKPLKVSLYFEPQMDIAVGESVYLALDGFESYETGEAGRELQVESMQPYDQQFKARLVHTSGAGGVPTLVLEASDAPCT